MFCYFGLTCFLVVALCGLPQAFGTIGKMVDFQKINSNVENSGVSHAREMKNIEPTSATTSLRPNSPLNDERSRMKRTPSGFSARGFHEGAFDRDFGHFSPVKRFGDASGFYGDTFSRGFGDFNTMKRGDSSVKDGELRQLYYKRRPEMGASGFHGDTFTQGFGDFDTMRKRFLKTLGGNSFYEAKRNPENNKQGFHSDVFSGGFGDFSTMKK